MRGTKGSYYEGGHRVPCFIRWPARGLNGGRDIGELSAHVDLLPTLIELCRLKAPQGVKFDGVSLAPVLVGRSKTLGPRTIVVQYSQTTTPPAKWRSAVMRQQWRLVGGKELYDVRADPGQKDNIAARHPDMVKRLRDDYEKWWSEVSKRFDETSNTILGSDRDNPVTLTAFDWHTSTPWNQSHIRGGSRKNGFWAVEVETDGTYQIALRRWPVELNKPISAAIKRGRAIPAKKARLKIADIDITQDIPNNAGAGTFTVKLKAGKTRLQTWFIDARARNICGAYYVYVKRL